MTFQRKKVLGSLVAIAMSALMAGASFAEGPSFNGFVDFGYNYNFNKQTTNVLRSFDAKSNSFTLQNAKLTATGTTKDSVTYRVDLMYGQDAKVTNYLNANAGDEFDIEQGFISFPCPVTHGTFTVGKFVTPFGAEVIEAKDDFNISRGLLFNYAIPLHHTGLKYDKSFGGLALTAGLVNGWDNMQDNNKGKTFLAQANYQITPKLKATLGGAYGPDGTGEKNGRSLVDALLTFMPTGKLTLIANADWGVEEGLGAVSSDNQTQNWQGVALHANYALSDANSVAVRYENFNDDGSRTGTLVGNTGPGFLPVPGVDVDGNPLQPLVINSLTFTLQHKMNSVIYRLEYRSDMANKKAFTDNNGILGNKKTQSTVGAQVIYAF